MTPPMPGVRADPRGRLGGRASTALEWSLVSVLFVGMTLAYTFPLWLHMSTRLMDLGDPLHDLCYTWWVSHRFATLNFTGIFDLPPQYYPARLPITFKDPQFGASFIGLPVYLATHSALASYNFVVLISIPLCALGAYALARHITGSRSAALIAGIAWGFGIWHNGQSSHMQLLSLEFLPFTLLMLHRFAETGRARDLVGVFAFWTAQEYTCLYWGQFMLLLIVPFAFFLFRVGYRLPWRKTLLGMGAIGAALVAWVPFLWPFIAVSSERHHPLSDVATWSANLADYAPLPGTVLWGHVGVARPLPPVERAEFALSPGLIVLVLACVACLGALDWKRVVPIEDTAGKARRRFRQRVAEWIAVILCMAIGLTYALGVSSLGLLGGLFGWFDQWHMAELAAVAVLIAVMIRFRAVERWFVLKERFAPWLCYAPLALIGMLWSCGMTISLYDWDIAPGIHSLIVALPGHGGIRAICRIGVIADLGLAVLAAFAVATLTKKLRRPHPRFAILGPVVAVGCLLILSENIMRYGVNFSRCVPVPPAGRPVDYWLAQQPRAPAIELPLTVSLSIEPMRIWHQTVHKLPLRNGAGAYTPPGYIHDVQVLTDPNSAAAVSDLRGLGIHYVILETANQYAGRSTFMGPVPAMPISLGPPYRLVYAQGADHVYILR